MLWGSELLFNRQYGALRADIFRRWGPGMALVVWWVLVAMVGCLMTWRGRVDGRWVRQ